MQNGLNSFPNNFLTIWGWIFPPSTSESAQQNEQKGNISIIYFCLFG